MEGRYSQSWLNFSGKYSLPSVYSRSTRETTIDFSQVVMQNFVKFFALKYFMKYFKNFTMSSFFRLYSYPFNIFIRQTLPFIHLCILQLPKPK